MLIFLRTAAVIIFAFSVALQRNYVCAFLPASAAVIALMYRSHGTSFLYILRRNSIIVPFSIMFAAFSLVSGYLVGDVRVHDSIILALKIILIFNIFLGGMQWIGTGGYMYLLNRIPSVRVRLFFLLLGNNMLRIMRNNREIVRQIRSRITLTGKNRLIIARYYFQNMLFKELYSMQHSHGALVLRLGESVSCHEYERNVRPLDFILFASVAGYCAAGAMMLCL